MLQSLVQISLKKSLFIALSTMVVMLSYTLPASAVEPNAESDVFFSYLNESVLPRSAAKAQSEVQVRKIQKMMSTNRDQTYSMMNELKALLHQSE